MSGPGGTRTVRYAAALIVGVLVAGGAAACAYEGSENPPPTSADQSHKPAPSAPVKGREVLDEETHNYVELDKRLSSSPGSVLLSDSGPVDGPGVGFTKAATVATAGPHTVTAACVGTAHAQIFLAQDAQGRTEHVFDIDCSAAQTQVVQLQKGHVSVQLTRQDPTGPWTGAVAGIRITAP